MAVRCGRVGVALGDARIPAWAGVESSKTFTPSEMCARDLGQDRRPPHPEWLPQDRCLDPRRPHPVRDGVRLVAWGELRLRGRRLAPSVFADKQPRAERPEAKEDGMTARARRRP